MIRIKNLAFLVHNPYHTLSLHGFDSVALEIIEASRTTQCGSGSIYGTQRVVYDRFVLAHAAR